MTTLSELCRKYFNTDDLYEVLNTNKNATDKEVRKAYYMLSMKYHPDKVAENKKAEATEKFKVISRVHALLNDADKRKLYDDNGCIDDDIDPNSKTEDFPWKNYFKAVFRTVTVDNIREYELKYKGSDDEIRDLKKGYLAGKGDMGFIINMVPFSSVHEEDRLREILEKIIKEENLPVYDAFTNEAPSKKRRRLQKAKREEALYKVVVEKKKQSSDGDDLILAIKKRSTERVEQFNNFIDGMEAKYCKAKPAKDKKKK